MLLNEVFKFVYSLLQPVPHTGGLLIGSAI